MTYTISDISNIIEADAHIQQDSRINFLLTDSRSLAFPEESLFFALKTGRNDGHKYIDSLYRLNVRNFVVSEQLPEFDAFGDANFLYVKNTLEALQTLSACHRKQFSIPVIGITGSNGKTIVKEWLYQLLQEDKQIVRSPRSYNSQIGVPLSVWQLNNDTGFGIFEAGISEYGEMKSLQKIILPNICVLTNIGEAHQENFTSLADKCSEKLILAEDCDRLIYNADDPLISSVVNRLNLQSRSLSWGSGDNRLPIYISGTEKQNFKTRISYVYQQKTSSFLIPFDDDASIENAKHCLAVMLHFGVSDEVIAERMARLEAVAMRLEVKEGKNNCILINDTYNSDIHSLDIALDFQLRRDSDKKLKHTLILSDILQSGIPDNELYRKVASLIVQRKIDKLIGIGKNIHENAAVFQSVDCEFYRKTEDFLQSGADKNLKNEIILIKGSRTFQFEKISEALELQVHETILEVDLDALVYNFNYYRSKLKPATKMICMVKAFAYGTGAYEVAKTLQDHHCSYLAVAVADEGAALRKAGLSIPVMVMNPEPSAFQTIFDNRLEPEIYSFRLLEAFIKDADKQGITNYPIHLKIDTGMHRLGFFPEEIEKVTSLLNRQNTLTVRSVFSHLACSEDPEEDDYTRMQIRIFTECGTKIDHLLGYKSLKHILNSEGIIRFPEAQMDMVRLGLGLYGVNSSGGLKNVTTLKTTILQIRELPPGETVGYNRKGVITVPSRIATIPIGYADGLNRKLGNGNLSVLINGKFAPTIGNICMDLSMIDVTNISCQEGDAVTIFGEEQPIKIPAQKLQTIPYEIITSISERVKRVYYAE
ncbi:MAG: bifunctional UDP-N-acetylmuramoyl-tripeptide:D-alanyl-D-alanine ligase/alanine racemase [Candidatus Azobacteroides sp.]|nr:bifunctional UDP-N-acetylmuramoyl-tripeptide:D-alanyl-D-alanine ligase/alanine racemase [Candidatus Azobacteroides sp.]